MARRKGLPSRAAFKLEELLARYRLVYRGARVLDLGCAPGGWLAVLAKAVGPNGRVVGVDLAGCHALASVITTLSGDLRDEEIRRAAYHALGGSADLVTCDMAPKLSGVRDRDREEMRKLLQLALRTASEILRPSGAFVGKVFMNDDLKPTAARFDALFAATSLVRPQATRRGSAELYLVATGFSAAGARCTK